MSQPEGIPPTHSSNFELRKKFFRTWAVRGEFPSSIAVPAYLAETAHVAAWEPGSSIETEKFVAPAKASESTVAHKSPLTNRLKEMLWIGVKASSMDATMV